MPTTWKEICVLKPQLMKDMDRIWQQPDMSSNWQDIYGYQISYRAEKAVTVFITSNLFWKWPVWITLVWTILIIIQCCGACRTYVVAILQGHGESSSGLAILEKWSCVHVVSHADSLSLAAVCVLCILDRDRRSTAGYSGLMSFVTVSSNCNTGFYQYHNLTTLQIHNIRLAVYTHTNILTVGCIIGEFSCRITACL